MIIKNFKPYKGQHCESNVTGSLLKHVGITLSEPMLFGLGEGLGFIFWNMKSMDFPFVGGRIRQDTLTQNLCKNLNCDLFVNETASVKKAWEQVKGNIDNGIPVGLKLDCYHLDYFTNKIHFAGHYVTMYGYDNEYAYVTDTAQQGSNLKVSLKNLELARNEKGPMSSKNLSYTINSSKKVPSIKDLITPSIKRNAINFLSPPISNIGYKGIIKTSKEIVKWFNTSKNIEYEFKTSAQLMERGGTGGSLFRNFYRDFLKESFEILNKKALDDACSLFTESAENWRQVAKLFEKAGDTKKIEFIDQAAELLKKTAVLEKQGMEVLLEL